MTESLHDDSEQIVGRMRKQHYVTQGWQKVPSEHLLN